MKENNSPWSWDGSFVRWRFCRERFCVGTITRVPLWLSFLQQKCLGWRIWGWWSRSYQASSSNFRQRFLQHRSRRASRLFLRCNPKLCWRWQSAKKSIKHHLTIMCQRVYLVESHFTAIWLGKSFSRNNFEQEHELESVTEIIFNTFDCCSSFTQMTVAPSSEGLSTKEKERNNYYRRCKR